MRGTYDLWLVACSYLVAVTASYAALEHAGPVVISHGRDLGLAGRGFGRHETSFGVLMTAA